MCSRFGVKEQGPRDQGTKGPRRQGQPPQAAVFTGPLQTLYSLFTKKGVIWSYPLSCNTGAIWGSRHVGDGVRIFRRETRIRCSNARTDSRGNRTLVHDLGALELAEGRAAQALPRRGPWHGIKDRSKMRSCNIAERSVLAKQPTACSIPWEAALSATGRPDDSLTGPLTTSPPPAPAYRLRRPRLPPALPSRGQLHS